VSAVTAPPPAARPEATLAPQPGAPTGWAAWARRHWLISVFVAAAVALRVAVSVAYWPGIELFGDSYDYLRLSHQIVPGTWHPSGYPLFLTVLSVTGQLGAVVVVQHLMGIASGVLVYVLALRLGARRWLAALAALPVLFDGYQLDLEQMILPETLTSLLLLAGVSVALWRERVGLFSGAAAALLLVAATLTRPEVVPVLVVVGLYLLIRAGRFRPFLAYCAVGVLLLAGYGAWYAATYGYFGYSSYAGFWLYGRVAPFATCRYRLPFREGVLCPLRPVGQRSNNSEYFADEPSSPIHSILWLAPQTNALGERFAFTVIENQPLDYAKAVLADTWHYFAPGRWMSSDMIDMQRWRFPPPRRDPHRGNYHVRVAREGWGGPIRAAPDASLTAPLRTYQWYVYTPGPVLLGFLVAALAAGLGLVRRAARRRTARWACLVLAVSSVAVVLVPSLTVGFSYRYGLPLLVLLPPAAAAAAEVGTAALARRRVRPGP
jgi:4-amino-4-deoxy-L-arabinose transferase-like glycosyltransferase